MSKSSHKSHTLLRNMKLGEILTSLDFIDKKKLKTILKKQKSMNLRLGEVIASLGIVDKEIVLALVGKQLGYAFVKLSEIDTIPSGTLQMIPKNIAMKHMLIPFEKTASVIKLAMSDPEMEDVKDAISTLTGLNVMAYISTLEEVEAAIEKHY